MNALWLLGFCRLVFTVCLLWAKGPRGAAYACVLRERNLNDMVTVLKETEYPV